MLNKLKQIVAAVVGWYRGITAQITTTSDIRPYRGIPIARFDLERAQQRRREGWGWKRIAREAGIAPTTIKRYLNGDIPKGFVSTHAAPASAESSPVQTATAPILSAQIIKPETPPGVQIIKREESTDGRIYPAGGANNQTDARGPQIESGPTEGHGSQDCGLVAVQPRADSWGERATLRDVDQDVSAAQAGAPDRGSVGEVRSLSYSDLARKLISEALQADSPSTLSPAHDYSATPAEPTPKLLLMGGGPPPNGLQPTKPEDYELRGGSAGSSSGRPRDNLI